MSREADSNLRATASLMVRRLAHRGPDGCGLWVAPSGRAVLAHTRLAIFDPRPAASQPMSTMDSRLTISYNGAIYNLAELRASLSVAGVTFQTASDTEVVLRAFERYGESCVHRLRGMFAIAIWDEQSQCGFLARDPFGIKPLYYADCGGRFAFASEIRALAASGLVRCEVDADSVYGYFRSGSVPESATLLQGIRMLPAGATARWQHGRLSLMLPSSAPWQVEPAGSRTDAVAATRAALLDSVANHFAGDARAAVLLSGGADSAAILASAAHSGHVEVDTISLALPGEAGDESGDAARVASAFGARNHVLAVDAARAREALADYAAAIDQPTIDGLNTFVVTRFAQELGFKVVLSGIGADELFGGYVSFAKVPAMERWHRRAARAGVMSVWAGLAMQRAASPRVRRVGDLLTQSPSLVRAYETFRGIFTRAEARQLTRHFAGQDPAEEDSIDRDDGDAADRVSILELTRYARHQLLRDADVFGMAAGVEVRTPFLDRRLVSTVFGIPSGTRLQAGKALLAAALPEVPSRAFAPPKRCFQFPFDRWLADGWEDVFADVGRDAHVPVETWYRKWSVFSLTHALRNVSGAHHA